MNVTADATTPGGLGSFRWDDEGVEGRPVPLIRDGVLTGFLSSRETAAEIGLERSGGCARSDGFARQPIVRMTNVNLEPGEAGSLDDLIADTERRPADRDQPLLVDRRPAPALPVRGRGRLGDPRRRARAAAAQPELLGGHPRVLAQLRRRLLRARVGLISVLECGKGEPGQFVRVSHGSAPARFRDVEVGVA